MGFLHLLARRSASLLAKSQCQSRICLSRPISQRAGQLYLPVYKRFLTQSSFLAQDGNEVSASALSTEDTTVSMSDRSPLSSASDSTSDQDPALAEADEAYSVSQPRKAKILELPPTQRVYIGNLFFEATEESLKDFIEPIGEVQEIMIQRDRRGLSKGYGFVLFRSVEDAIKAVGVLQGKIFMGRRMTVNYMIQKERRTREKSPPSRTIFIGNISFSMTDKDLSNLFRPIKNVIDVRVAIDRRTGQPRGYAHADFIDIASATQAMQELEQVEMYGRKLQTDFSKTPAVGNIRRNQNLGAKEHADQEGSPEAASGTDQMAAQETGVGGTQEAAQDTTQESAQENASDALEDSIADTAQQETSPTPEAQSSVASDEHKP